MTKKRNRPDRTPLDRAQIVEASITLADEAGLEALSMRQVAHRLGFEVMALYNHVASKDELLAAMIDAVAEEIGQPAADLAPLAAVRALAVATHDMLVRHTWAPAIWLRHLPGPARTQQMEDLLRLLDESGLSAEVAHHGFHAVNNHVIGYTLQQLGMRTAPDAPDAEAVARSFLRTIDHTHPRTAAHIQEHLDRHTAGSFEFVLDLILDGLVRVDAATER